MTCRVLIGNHPPTGEVGLWVANPGYDCMTSDRTSRAAFRVSTSFPNRRPFRIVASGLKNSNTSLILPTSLAGLGGSEPLLAYRVMQDANTERENGYYGVQTGNYTASGTEFYSRFFDENPARFVIYNRQNPNSTDFLIKYMVFIF